MLLQKIYTLLRASLEAVYRRLAIALQRQRALSAGARATPDNALAIARNREELMPIKTFKWNTVLENIKSRSLLNSDKREQVALVRKAPGRDTISIKVLKCFSAPLVAQLVAIFNACIRNCYFPAAWKEAVVIGIPKPGKPRDLPASYRPISLLSVLGKLFEKTLKTRLSDHLIGKGLIINEQFGFRLNHSCPQQALRLIEYISDGFTVKRKTVAVFFDVAKALDRVWHAGLIYKLYKLELPDRLVIVIHNYISNCHFSFRLDNTYSSMRPIRAGVPQGSTLSPLLYSAYVNDIPRPSTSVQLALFADDTALYLRSNCIRNILPRLQRAIDELTQWFRLWRIDVNPEKSASIYFDYSPQKLQFPVPINTPHLRMLNQPIPWQHNYKYLGITIDKHLHFRDHIARVRKLALFYLSRLYVQNNFSKRAADAPWYVKNSVLHRDLELPTISKCMKDASERFFNIANSHPNPLLVSAVSYEPPPPTHFCRRPWNVLIDPHDELTDEVEKLIEVNKMAIE
ncbi:RNA-directed DNA polymerase from mobile element jockey [Eumeta japonica]|uniref:RNA-directed DNA polymerase from mobile element jockey n=1 Tax=Eumeta variegata TaxID=151549 RepID=A0A4C1W5W7_EUMVA|nr:RNA-directed DNA polymerase from mobile element jockey [Eumeta japonica]